MSKYTTGEIAKLCNVSVRTVQFYDSKKILVPTEVTQGGRRMYSEENLKKLQLICLLKSLGLKLIDIKDILDNDYANTTFQLILSEQSKQLGRELKEKQSQLEAIETVQTILKNSETIPTEILTDIEHIMKEEKKLKKVHYVLIFTGTICGLIQYSTFALGLIKGIWIPFILGLILVITLVLWFTWYYRKNINYICPKCNTVFHPSFSEFVWAKHTFKTRKLKCPNCSYYSYCVETTNKISQKEV